MELVVYRSFLFVHVWYTRRREKHNLYYGKKGGYLL